MFIPFKGSQVIIRLFKIPSLRITIPLELHPGARPIFLRKVVADLYTPKFLDVRHRNHCLHNQILPGLKSFLLFCDYIISQMNNYVNYYFSFLYFYFCDQVLAKPGQEEMLIGNKYM